MSLERKLKRAKLKQSKKKMQETLGLFDKIPDHCLTCFAPYDKKNKEQVTSWSVVVRNNEKRVNLYCPDCWNKARDLLKEIEGDICEKTDA
jgi:hypothetical protein